MKPSIAAALMPSFVAISPSSAEDILIHRGPEVFTPKLKLLSPFQSQPGDGEKMRLIKEFFVSPEHFAELDAGLPALTRDEAIAVMTDSIRAEGLGREIEVTKVEKLQADPDGRAAVEYQLITIQVDGSEEHRVVLADGTVLKPRLRPLPEE